MNSESRRASWRKATQKYRDNNPEKVRAIKQKYIQDRRCTTCSAKLVQGENKTCVNCGNTIKGELKYAKDSLQLTIKVI